MELVKKALLNFLKVAQVRESRVTDLFQVVFPQEGRALLEIVCSGEEVSENEVLLERVNSYGQDVFCCNLRNIPLVIKVNRHSGVYYLLKKEFEVLTRLSLLDQDVFSVPTVLAYYSSEEMEFILSVWVKDSKTLTHTPITREVLQKVAVATQLIQGNLNLHFPGGINVNRLDEVAGKIRKFSIMFVGKELDMATELSRVGVGIPEITKTSTFSDRGTDNWLIDAGGHLHAIDFGLTTNGHPLEDWITFIDSIGFSFVGQIERRELMEIFTSQFTWKDITFRQCEIISLYRNVMQACLLYSIDKEKSHWHFDKAIASSRVISLDDTTQKLVQFKNESFGI